MHHSFPLIHTLAFVIRTTWSNPIPNSVPSHAEAQELEANSLKIGPSVVEVTPQWSNIFPAANFNRNVSVPIWQTHILRSNGQNATHDLNALEKASFLVYQPEFYGLLGIEDYKQSKQIETLFTFPPGPSYASRVVHDAPVYAPECNCIFFAELYPPDEGFGMQAIPWVWRVNLNTTKPHIEKVYPDPPLTIANGAYYHNGNVYWIQEGNYTTPGGIIRMNPTNLKTEIVLNNFYGHRFNSPNDVAITPDSIAFFTDGYYGYDNFNDTLEPQLANGVYRWDMKTGNIKMVAGAGDGMFVNPNGVALDHEQNKLFVSGRGESSDDPAGARTIWKFDITETGIRNGEVFAYVDAGFPDGIKLDKDGRVYGGTNVIHPHVIHTPM